MMLLMQHVGWWYGLWYAFHDLSDMPLWQFALSLSIPASLYVMSRLLVPDLDRQESVDFADRFQEVKTPFYVSVAIGALPYSGIRFFLYDASNQAFMLVIGVLAIAGLAFAQSIRSHYAVAIAILATYTSFLLVARGVIGGG